MAGSWVRWVGIEMGWRSEAGDAYAVGGVEAVAAGDHDALALLQAFEDLHGVEADRAGGDRPAFGAAAVHHVGEAATLLLQERTALDHQHVLPAVEQDPHRQALVLAQAGGLLVTEAHP